MQITDAVALRVTLPLVALTTHDTTLPPALAPLAWFEAGVRRHCPISGSAGIDATAAR